MLLAEEGTRLENLVHDSLVLAIEEKSGLEGFHLGFEEAESIWICDFKAYSNVGGQLFIRLAQLLSSVGVGAVLAEVALLLLLEVLANLGFVVVVGDVQHFVLDFNRKLLKNRKRQRNFSIAIFRWSKRNDTLNLEKFLNASLKEAIAKLGHCIGNGNSVGELGLACLGLRVLRWRLTSSFLRSSASP